MEPKLPFSEGQEVEAKSFEVGFRGAWFRCKILKISTREGETWFDLEYFDFPGEEITPTKAYQYREHDEGVSGQKNHLMVRPRFPTLYRKSEMPNIDMISEEAVIVNDDWRVGDVVDWWTNTSFWMGTVTGIKENGEIKIMLIPSPVGEGGENSALSNDLRPTLNWSLENGWTVRSPRCAKLIKPLINDDSSKIEAIWGDTIAMIEVRSVDIVTGPQMSCNNHNGSLEAESLLHVKHTHEDDSSDRNKMNIGDQVGSDTLEAVVSNLVVLSCKMKKMKGIVKMGGPSARISLPSWKFAEHRAPPM